MSDATLTLLDSNNNAKIVFRFVDAFPISLQGLDFEIVTGSTDYMIAVAMFKYSYLSEYNKVPLIVEH